MSTKKKKKKNEVVFKGNKTFDRCEEEEKELTEEQRAQYRVLLSTSTAPSRLETGFLHSEHTKQRVCHAKLFHTGMDP